ncbi:uncharacterized protein ACRADG_001795 [Cochliomyia hominivorax]
MWKICATVSLLLASVQAGQLSDYSITPSNQVAYYHYPAPPKSQQLNSPAEHTLSSIPIPALGHSPMRSVQGAAQAYQNQYHGSAQYASNYRTSITKQFTSPALDNAAFNLALSNQGYTIGNTATVNAASRSSKTTSTQSVASPATPASSSSSATTTSQSSSSSSSSSAPSLASLNVKLPLPIGVTPLNIAPLPLQGGAPYTAIPNAVTSYGTPYPQRKRR